jgi:hypothetical protein
MTTASRRAASTYGPWFNYVTRREQPALRLLCVGGAGSGPSGFVQWKDHLPDHTEIWPVQLPGRERRIRETPSADLSGLVDDIHQALEAIAGNLTGSDEGVRWGVVRSQLRCADHVRARAPHQHR